MPRFGLLVLVLVLLLLTLPAWCTVFRSGEQVTITEAVSDDLVVSGSQVDVRGRVAGDLVAAGGTVTVNGPVAGNLVIAGGTVTLNAPVTGAVIAAAGTLTLNGAAGGSAYLAGGTVTVNRPVARNAVATAGTLTVNEDATVGRDLTASGGTVNIRSRVARNVQADAGTLALADSARVGGDLRARVGNSSIAPGAVIAGQRQLARTETHRGGGWWAGILGGLFGALMLLLAGLLFVALAPRLTEETETALRARPGMSALAGVILLLIGFPLFLLLLITIIGIPLALIWLWVYLTAVFLSPIFVAILLGRLVWRRPGGSLYLALLIGVGLLFVIRLIPVLGFLVTLSAWIFGLGALTLALFDRFHRRHATTQGPLLPPEAPPQAA